MTVDPSEETREYERTPLTPISMAEYREFRRWKTRRGEKPPTYHPPIELMKAPTLDDPPSLGRWVFWGLVVGAAAWFLVMLL